MKENLLASAQLTGEKCWMIISEQNFDQIITFPSVLNIVVCVCVCVCVCVFTPPLPWDGGTA